MRLFYIFILILSTISQDSYNQENSYIPFSSKKYFVSCDSIAFSDFYINVCLVEPTNKKSEKELWIYRVNGKLQHFYSSTDSFSIAESQYIGSIDYNGKIYIPKIKPINDYLIFVFDGLKTQQVILCKGHERRVLLGNRFAFTNDSIFIYVKSENSDFIYRYNIKLDKISKIRTLPRNVELNYYEFKKEDEL